MGSQQDDVSQHGAGPHHSGLQPRHQLPLLVPPLQTGQGQAGVQQADLHHRLLHRLRADPQHDRPQHGGGPSVPVSRLSLQLPRRPGLHLQLRASSRQPAGLLLHGCRPDRHLHSRGPLRRGLSQVLRRERSAGTVRDQVLLLGQPRLFLHHQHQGPLQDEPRRYRGERLQLPSSLRGSPNHHHDDHHHYHDPPSTDCITIGGPGAAKPCLATFSYDHSRTAYKGCINQETPGQYLALVPDFGDNGPAPKDKTSEKLTETESVSFLAPRHSSSDTIRTLFWCATETDSDGYVSEWGQCAAGCRADPAGSYLPAAPRTAEIRGCSPTVGDLLDLIQTYSGPPTK